MTYRISHCAVEGNERASWDSGESLIEAAIADATDQAKMDYPGCTYAVELQRVNGRMEAMVTALANGRQTRGFYHVA